MCEMAKKSVHLYSQIVPELALREDGRYYGGHHGTQQLIIPTPTALYLTLA